MTVETGLAVVTGAARGIGRAIAQRLGRDGMVVLAVDLSEALDDSVERLRAEGLAAAAVRADLATGDGVEAVAAAVAAHATPLHVLVNNAGITRDALLTKMGEDAFLAVVRVNLGAPYALTRRLLPAFADRGAIVNVSSRAYLGNVGQFNYAASKGGLVGLTRALALELAPRLRVNAVAPGLVATEMGMSIPEAVRDEIVAGIPAGRMAEPEEIANTVAFLAGSDASYVSGQVVLVCGARSL